MTCNESKEEEEEEGDGVRDGAPRLGAGSQLLGLDEELLRMILDLLLLLYYSPA